MIKYNFVFQKNIHLNFYNSDVFVLRKAPTVCFFEDQAVFQIIMT